MSSGTTVGGAGARRVDPAEAQRRAEEARRKSAPSQQAQVLWTVLLVGFLVLGCDARTTPPPAPAASPAPEHTLARTQVEGEVLVRFRDGIQAMEQDPTRGLKGARVLHRFRKMPGLQLVKLPEGMSVEQALSHYRRDPRVAFAEPNAIYTPSVLPVDPRFRELWGFHNTGQTLGGADMDINVPEAWELTQGSEADVVAVIDSGVDFTHPDLADNMWVNPGEIAGNGVDDDGNGYVDDVHGIDATDETKTPMDVNGHGTHVAGTIAARGGNGLGVVGVSPRTKLLACKVEDADGFFTLDAAVRCLDYLLDLKTRARHPVNLIASNASWGGSFASQALSDAITGHLHAGILFVAAAGNLGMNMDFWMSSYPAEFTLPNILSVGASDDLDRRARFSNYGHQKVDIFAPGVSILSTVPGGGHAVFSGTSMAAPHVTGLVALLHAQSPERDWRALRNLVLSGGQEVPALRDLSVTGRRIRAIDTGGGGSMSCAEQSMVRRLEPSGDIVHSGSDRWYDYQERMTLAALNIRCEQSAGSVTVQLSIAPWSLVLLDDGQGADMVAGDGIATAEWDPPSAGPVVFTFPGGDSFTAHPRYSGTADIYDWFASWRPEVRREASFRVDFVGDGTPGPWEVQWDADYDGHFDVDATTSAPATPHSYTEVISYTALVPPSPEATAVAVRIIDANGNPSHTVQAAPNFIPDHPSPVRLGSDVLVPQVRHPFTLDVAFLAPAFSEPWTLEWDLDHDGKTFHPTAWDSIPVPEEENFSQARAHATRMHVFSSAGVHRVALRVVDNLQRSSVVQTWGAVVECGPPVILDVGVEGSGRTEPVTAGLSARAEPGCEPILRYHWDFDGDGTFDEMTAEPSTRHVYPDNPPGLSSQRGIVRVESATGYFDRAFEIPIENVAPRVEPIPEQLVTSQRQMTYQVQVSNPGGAGDALTFSVAGAPDWVQVSATGLLSWVGPWDWVIQQGEHLRFELVVRDDDGAETRTPVELVAAYRPEQPPVEPRSDDSGGCSTTGGASPSLIVSLGLLLAARRRKR
ncbi:S8 family serine peptidase [Corallococcus exiguus]|uniref:S8 family peptidase n=1 Tax=Corallococcus exiguus TaxID=83462 RepID=UPI003D2E4EB7